VPKVALCVRTPTQQKFPKPKNGYKRLVNSHLYPFLLIADWASGFFKLFTEPVYKLV